MQPDIYHAIEEQLGYRFRNRALLRQALTRSSYFHEMQMSGTPSDTPSNEVLEFLGDSLLSAALAYLLIRRYGTVGENGLETRLAEGGFSAIKSKMSDKTALSRIIGEMGLQSYLRVSRGDRLQGVQDRDSPREDLFESLVAAVALDSGMNFETVLALVERLDRPERLLGDDADAGAEQLQTLVRKQVRDAKTRLKEYCEKQRIPCSYTQTGVRGPEHNCTYTVCCTVTTAHGAVSGTGEGPSRRKAEQAAAEAALAVLEAAD